ncbi:SinI family restriction endonuclease [Nostoc sp.]|uniref:SinI family restriction endonuclease n=1 Tax=Nostoc sp. TaxID=1180 RepID=UPI002FF82CC8
MFIYGNIGIIEICIDGAIAHNLNSRFYPIVTVSNNLKIPDFDANLIVSEAENIAKFHAGMFWNDSVKTVLSVCCNSPELFPYLKVCNSRLDYITKWLNKYFGGYNNRASKRTSKKIGTVSDKIIDTIISARLPTLSTDGINHIKYAHRLSMSAENVLGLLLEEYLAEKLSFYGWYCAWGETINKVDFCTKKGELLQVKIVVILKIVRAVVSVKELSFGNGIESMLKMELTIGKN